ncbi:MAG TPA: IS1634 family transposase [Candidatus Sumerlaeota bacterium]|nr:IS1634 family transposase [Candidatus Sumerlaeota bacterium]
MFFRIKISPSGKVLQLLEAFRNDQGQPRNRVVTSLGNADIPSSAKDLVAKAVENRLYGRQEFFNWQYDEPVQCWIDTIVRKVDLEGRWKPLGEATDDRAVINGVFIEEIAHENSTLLGPILLARHAWNQLKMDSCLESMGLNHTQRLAVAANVINRLVDPVSENALQGWLGRTAMPELYGHGILKLKRDQFYRGTDSLLKKRREIEAHVRSCHRSLFSLHRTLFLYDLTNSYYEGSAKRNPKAKRGHSKHKRNDCPQIVLGMVFDSEGFELGHEIFDGNRKDSSTLLEIIERLREFVKDEAAICERGEKPLVILDGGIATRENINLLRNNGISYLVNETRRGRKKWRKEFLLDQEFEAIPDRVNKRPVKVRLIEQMREDNETDLILLCKSEGRLEKEKAIRSAVEEKYLDRLEHLKKRITSGRLKEPQKIERALGRIQERHSRVNRFYEIQFERESLTLSWKRDEEKYGEDDELLGCYALRTDRKEYTQDQIWNIYMTLTRAEEGFRSVKMHLGLRPFRHHTEDRTDAHIFISVLAYHLLRTLLYPLETSGDTRSWETIKRILSTHCYTTIHVPTKGEGTYRIRKAGKPDETQKGIYNALGINWKNLPGKVEKNQRKS